MKNAVVSIDTTPRLKTRPYAVAGLAITVLSGLICYGLFVERGVWLSVIGYSVSPAERVLQGEVPYRDFLYNYTPGTLWVNALLMRLFGANLMAVNYGLLGFKLVTLAVLFWLGRRLTSGWVALIPIGLTLAWLGHRYVFGVVPTQYSLVFVLAAMLCALEYDRSGKRSWLLPAGMAVGAVLVFKYNVGLILLPIVTAAIGLRELMTASEPRFLRTSKVVLVMWLGFGAVAGAMLAYLAASGALGPMIDHFLHHASEYSESRAVALPSPRLVAPVALASVVVVLAGLLVLRMAPRLLAGYAGVVLAAGGGALLVPGRAYLLKQSAIAAVSYVPLLLFVGVCVAAVYELLKCLRGGYEREHWWARHGAMVIVAAVSLGAYLEMYPRADDYHLVRVLPPVFLLLTVVTARLFPVLESGLRRWLEQPRRTSLVIASIPLVLLFICGLHSTWRPHFDSSFRFVDRVALSIERARGVEVSPRLAELVEGLAGIIESHSSPGDPVFSFAQRGSGFYFLTGRSNPTRFVWWRSVGIDERSREEVLAMIHRKDPKLIILQDSLSNKEVRQTVTQNYHEVGRTADLAVYGRNQ